MRLIATVCEIFSRVKPRSHSAGMAPVHPGEGQPVYRDEPGHFFLKNRLRSHSPDVTPVLPPFKRKLAPVESRFTTE